MEIDEFLELVRKRRSIRRFKPNPIPDAWVDKILEAGRWAMSGANAQPWEFIVVKDQETKNKMASVWLELRGESDVIETTRVKELRHAQHARPHVLPSFKDAPVLIVVCGDRRTYQATVLATNYIGGEGGPGATYLKSMANATQNMHLAAAALGVGSQWYSVNRLWEQSLRVILDVPPVLEIHTVVVVGYPAYEPPPPYRRELKEIVHFEKYDRSKYRSGDDIIKFIRNLRHHLRKQTEPAYEQPSSF